MLIECLQCSRRNDLLLGKIIQRKKTGNPKIVTIVVNCYDSCPSVTQICNMIREQVVFGYSFPEF